jgi:hypothetical protein
MNPLLLLHVTGGVIAIAAGLVALYALKGATLHRRTGTIFVCAMPSMSLSGTLMAAVKRYLWRMCAALFIAFFLGPVGRIPVPLRAPVLRLIPLLVLVTLAFWLWRLRRRHEWPRVVAGGVPEAV